MCSLKYCRLNAKSVYTSFRSAGISLTLRLGEYKERERNEPDISRLRQ